MYFNFNANRLSSPFGPLHSAVLNGLYVRSLDIFATQKYGGGLVGKTRDIDSFDYHLMFPSGTILPLKVQCKEQKWSYLSLQSRADSQWLPLDAGYLICDVSSYPAVIRYSATPPQEKDYVQISLQADADDGPALRLNCLTLRLFREADVGTFEELKALPKVLRQFELCRTSIRFTELIYSFDLMVANTDELPLACLIAVLENLTRELELHEDLPVLPTLEQVSHEVQLKRLLDHLTAAKTKVWLQSFSPCPTKKMAYLDDGCLRIADTESVPHCQFIKHALAF